MVSGDVLFLLVCISALGAVEAAQSRIFPSVEMVTTCHGMNLPLF